MAAFALLSDTAVAVATVTYKNGLVPHHGDSGCELNIALGALAAVVVLLGTGPVSVGYRLRRNSRSSRSSRR